MREFGLKVVGHPWTGERVSSWSMLSDYDHNDLTDVKFRFGPMYNAHTWETFEIEWKSRGLVSIYEVCDLVGYPRNDIDRSFIDDKFLVAKFANEESATLFKLMLDDEDK